MNSLLLIGTKCGQGVGGGVKKSETFADFIYGWSLRKGGKERERERDRRPATDRPRPRCGRAHYAATFLPYVDSI